VLEYNLGNLPRILCRRLTKRSLLRTRFRILMTGTRVSVARENSEERHGVCFHARAESLETVIRNVGYWVFHTITRNAVIHDFNGLRRRNTAGSTTDTLVSIYAMHDPNDNLDIQKLNKISRIQNRCRIESLPRRLDGHATFHLYLFSTIPTVYTYWN
jgi:hypothetical protein